MPFKSTIQKRHAAGVIKVGTTAGWVVSAANNLGVGATVPASQTASTLVMRLSNLNSGDVLRSFSLAGHINSAGGAVTLDAQLRKLTPAAGSFTDSLVKAMTQVSVTAATILSDTNTKTDFDPEVIDAQNQYYLLLTATTAASTDAGINGGAIFLSENYIK